MEYRSIGALEYWINDVRHGKTISSSFSITPTLHYSKRNSFALQPAIQYYKGQRLMLTADEKQRYHRQILLSGWGEEGQEKIKRSTVFIAGAGGLGSPVAIYLAAAGVGRLRICDSGATELTNLNRQVLHGEGDVGRNKTRSARETIARINPLVTVDTLEDHIVKENVARLVGDADIIVDCMDNFSTRHVLNAYAVVAGLPFVHAGVTGMSGQITFLHTPATPCLFCFVPKSTPPAVFPIVGATAGMIGTLEALEVLKYLTGKGALLKNRMLFWDGELMQFHEVPLQKDPRCPVCRKQ